MTITVAQLSRNCGEIEIQRTTREQLDMIDHLLKTMSKTIGRNHIKIPLPVCFPEIATNNKDVIQIIIYNNILRSLEERGFTVSIEYEGKDTGAKLIIEWVNRLDIHDINKMNTYVKSKTRILR